MDTKKTLLEFESKAKLRAASLIILVMAVSLLGGCKGAKLAQDERDFEAGLSREKRDEERERRNVAEYIYSFKTFLELHEQVKQTQDEQKMAEYQKQANEMIDRVEGSNRSYGLPWSYRSDRLPELERQPSKEGPAQLELENKSEYKLFVILRHKEEKIVFEIPPGEKVSKQIVPVDYKVYVMPAEPRINRITGNWAIAPGLNKAALKQEIMEESNSIYFTNKSRIIEAKP